METAIKKTFKELKESSWFWIPVLIAVLLLTSFMYYKSNYCKKIPCIMVGKKCISYHTETNGFSHGKYYREWEVCDGYEYYEYESTYDSCGCDKIK